MLAHQYNKKSVSRRNSTQCEFIVVNGQGTTSIFHRVV